MKAMIKDESIKEKSRHPMAGFFLRLPYRVLYLFLLWMCHKSARTNMFLKNTILKTPRDKYINLELLKTQEAFLDTCFINFLEDFGFDKIVGTREEVLKKYGLVHAGDDNDFQDALDALYLPSAFDYKVRDFLK